MDIYSSEGKKKIIKDYTPPSKTAPNALRAFVFGGFICAAAEALRHLYLFLGASEDNATTLVSVTLISLAAILTAFGVFDKIARVGCAGTLVPITGFSNAIVSEAIDSKSEGYVLGVGSKIYTVAGPVILFGLTSGVLYGIIYYTVITILNYIM